MVKTTRFSGADWADQQRTIMIVGVGGIGSWLALNLSRIGHSVYMIDPDNVDKTNVEGGQMFAGNQVNTNKVDAVKANCRLFGCDNPIDGYAIKYTEETVGSVNIIMTGLDNMEARKEVFDGWKQMLKLKTKEKLKECILIDGRLNMEMYEILSVRGDDKLAIKEYGSKYLFNDSETTELDCTTKQSTFGAFGIASMMTATLCNFLTNLKIGTEFREVPFYQRMFLPMMHYTTSPAVHEAKIELTETSLKTDIITHEKASN